MNPGAALLYLSLATGLTTIAMLVYEQVGKKEAAPIKWLVRTFAGLLLLDFSLLLYYFAVSDVSYDYVWSFTSKYYPLYYKLSGALAGQEGTLLFWALLIAMGSLWLNESRDSTSDFVRKAQLIVMSLGTYFVALTLLDSPFKTIYEAYPDLPGDFLPRDGAGLNPLLLDPWMALHPFTMFIGYAGVTVPFAGAMIYLLKSLRNDSKELHKQWIGKASQWCRIAWLFLTVAIAFGGIWSYKVLGWGGFWAWDPIETASLIPWLVLTGALHALAEHRNDVRKYSILAPVLVSMSFALVIYATLVTRSGVFESVHAFIAGGAGPYLIILASVSLAAPLALGLIKYLKTEGKSSRESLISRTNILYLAVLSFIALTFISFFGITYPAMIKMLTGNKYAVGSSFFNIWSYPFFLFLMLLAGLGLSYRPQRRRQAAREFLLFAALTFAAALIKPAEGWNIVDYSAIISPQKPFLYALIGSASVLSFLPPSAYIVYAALRRGEGIRRLKSHNKKAREAGILTVHVGIALIIIGAAFSTTFTNELTSVLDIRDRQSIAAAYSASLHERQGAWGVHEGKSLTAYGVKLLDYREEADYKSDELFGMSVKELLASLEAGQPEGRMAVYGLVEKVESLGNLTIIILREGDDRLWVVSPEPLAIGNFVVVSGYLHYLADGGSFRVSLIADAIVDAWGALNKLSRAVDIEVYRNNKPVARGTVKLEEYPKTDVRRVMIDRGFLGDVYGIFLGKDGDRITVTIKLIPLVNFLWLGVVLFTVGVIAVILGEAERM
jgi:cytochrome c-type biogenesis protein CcmF